MADGWVMGRDFFESQSSTGTFYTCNHRRVVIRIPQKKATNVDPPNSELGRKWAECIDKEPKRAKRGGGRGVAGVGNQSASCPQLKYLEVLRQSGELERRTSFMSSLVSSSFCLSLASQVCLFRKCICQLSYTGIEEES